MKKIVLAIVLLFMGLCAYSAQYDYKQINLELKACEGKTSDCYYKVFSKYPINQVRYIYAQALFFEKSYDKAKTQFQYIVSNEKTDTQLLAKAKTQLQSINELYAKMRAANSMDAGHYLKDLSNYARWQNPGTIRVYIEPGAKKAIIKQAFDIWDNRMYKVINFVYVDSPQKAQIECKVVNNFNDSAVGKTYFGSLSTVASKKYFSHVRVEIALYSNSGRALTDTNILGVTLHEIGHALGIADHSPNMNDIMYPTTETFKNTSVSNRDYNTLQRIYR